MSSATSRASIVLRPSRKASSHSGRVLRFLVAMRISSRSRTLFRGLLLAFGWAAGGRGRAAEQGALPEIGQSGATLDLAPRLIPLAVDPRAWGVDLRRPAGVGTGSRR